MHSEIRRLQAATRRGSRRQRRRRGRAAYVLIAAVSAALPATHALADDSWTGGGDGVSWTDPNNWSAGVPASGITADIITSGATAVTVVYGSTSPVTLGSFTLDLTGGAPGATDLFVQAANTLSVNGEFIGRDGNGSYVQSGGSNSTINLDLGVNVGSTGWYSLTNAKATVSNNLYLGGPGMTGAGVGILKVNNSASLNVVGTVIVGNTPGSEITLKGGSITAGALSFGASSSILNWTSGTLTITGTGGLTLDSAAVPNAGSTFILAAGQNLNSTSGEYVGYSGAGAITQSGGVNTINAGNLYIGYNIGSSGLYSTTGGATSVTGSAYIGGSATSSGGTGVLTVGGSASFTTTGTLSVWNNPGNQINLNGGSITADVISTSGNPALFNWTSGTLSVTGANGLTVGSTGPLGSSLSLLPGQNLIVSNDLNLLAGASLSLNGGNLTAESIVPVSGASAFSWSSGALTITAGGLTVDSDNVGAQAFGSSLALAPGQKLTTSSNQYIGYSGAGTVNQTGGINTINSGTLDLGVNPGSYGSYSMTGGVTNITYSAYVGGSSTASGGTGVLTVAGSGSFSTIGTLKVWNNPGNQINLAGGSISTGVLDTSGNPALFNWSSGALSITGGNELWLGASGPVGASLSITPGKFLNVSGELEIAPGATFALSGGAATAEYFSLDSTASTFTWSNGALTLALAASISPAGNINTLGSTIAITADKTLTAGGEFVGSSNTTCSITQTGGTNTVTGNGSLDLQGSTCLYNLSGSSTLIVGQGGTGGSYEWIGNESNLNPALTVFTQTGGANILETGELELGGYSGTYILTGGSLSVLANNEGIGDNGNGYFIQSGGTNTTTQILAIGNPNAGLVGTGTYIMSGGTASAVQELVGNTSLATFNQSAGLNETTDLYLGGCFISRGGAKQGGTGFYTLNGMGVLTALEEDIGAAGKGSNQPCIGVFNQSAGTNDLGTAGLLSIGVLCTIAATAGATSTGTYCLSSSGVLSAGSEIIGNGGVGVFNQSSGNNIIQGTGSLYIGGGPAPPSWVASGLLTTGGRGSYSLSGGSLAVAGSEIIGIQGTGTFTQTGGTNTAAMVRIGSGGSFTQSAGLATLGAVANNGSFQTLGGTATLGAVSGTGTLVVGSTAALAATGVMVVASVAQNSLTVNNSGLFQISQSQNGPPTTTSVVTSLTISGTGQIDITNNTLQIPESNTSLPQLTSLVQSGTIMSSLVTGPNAQASRAVGYGDNTENPATVPAGMVEAKYVPIGDTNLDGVVNITDYTTAVNNFNLSPGYSGGDVLNQGIVNIADITAIVNDFNATLDASGNSVTSGARSLTVQPAAHASVGFVAAPAASAALAPVISSAHPATPAAPAPRTASAAGGVVHSGGAISGSGTSAAPDGTVTYVMSINDDGFGHYAPDSFAIYAIDGTVKGSIVTANSVAANDGHVDGGIDNVFVSVQGAAAGSLYDDLYGGSATLRAAFSSSLLHEDNHSTIVAAGQDTVGNSPPPIVFGLGQVSETSPPVAMTTGAAAVSSSANSATAATAPGTTPATFTLNGTTYLTSLLVASGSYLPGTLPSIDTTQSTAGLFAAYGEVSDNGGYTGAGDQTVVVALTQTLTSSVPEPTSLGLLAAGALGLLGRRRRRQPAARPSP